MGLWDPKREWNLKMRLGGQTDWVLCQGERSFFPGQPKINSNPVAGKRQVSVPLGPEKRVELENETLMTNRLGPVSLRALVFSRPAFKEIQIYWREN